MITLRGDLGSETLALAIASACGCAIPERRRMEISGGCFVAWMSHDELLVRVPEEKLESVLADLDDALGEENALLSDVSDARVTFRITGLNARETLAKGCPSNLSHDAFGPGDFIRTRLGQVPVALWMPDPESIALMCFRSVGAFVGELARKRQLSARFPVTWSRAEILRADAGNTKPVHNSDDRGIPNAQDGLGLEW